MPQIVFTDEQAQLAVPSKLPKEQTEVAYELSLLTRNGLEKIGQRNATIAAGASGFTLKPEAEGVHIVRFTDGGEDKRFLAIAPPSRLEEERIRKALPLTAPRLLAGEPYVIGAYGDSVTATGHYPEILAKLLGRAIGGERGHPVQIRVVRRAHSGRSIDATMRTWDSEIASDPPQLAMIMYGLNDQAAGVSLDAYLEHYEVLAQRLRQELKADVIFLQPTPHIDVFPKPAPKTPGAVAEKPNPPSYAFRTIAYAKELQLLAQRLGLPCAETFQAIWGDGGPTLIASAEKMRALYPPSYSKPMQSMLESENPMAGDTIHPNILGHLAMARAVLAAIGDSAKSNPTLDSQAPMQAASRWEDGKIVTELKNVPSAAGSQIVEIYGMPDLTPLSTNSHVLVHTGKPTETNLVLQRADIAVSQEVLKSGAGREFAAGRGMIAVVMTSQNITRVTAVPARLSPRAVFERKRWNAVENTVDVKVTAGFSNPDGTDGEILAGDTVKIDIPASSEGGTMLLSKNLRQKDSTEIPAFARLWYTRYALAEIPSGEDAIKLDGDLNDWEGATWSTLGDPLHARWTRGPQDNRATPEECWMKFAIKAGKSGIYLAINGKGDISRDRFTLYFDSRAPELLGSPGMYYWVSGDFSKYPAVKMRNGETSPSQPASRAELRQTAQGNDLEVFVPYEVIGNASWPESGDLGFSFWWTHAGADKKATQLQWSDTGHPWNTRWYGVIRRGKPGDPMPFMVRVE